MVVVLSFLSFSVLIFLSFFLRFCVDFFLAPCACWDFCVCHTRFCLQDRSSSVTIT